MNPLWRKFAFISFDSNRTPEAMCNLFRDHLEAFICHYYKTFGWKLVFVLDGPERSAAKKGEVMRRRTEISKQRSALATAKEEREKLLQKVKEVIVIEDQTTMEDEKSSENEIIYVNDEEDTSTNMALEETHEEEQKLQQQLQQQQKQQQQSFIMQANHREDFRNLMEMNENIEKMERNQFEPTPAMKAAARELLEKYDLPFILSPGDFEADHVMASVPNLYAVMTVDQDLLLYPEVKYWIDDFDRKTDKVQVIETKDMLDRLGFTQKQMIEMCILIGTDYNPKGVVGIGAELGYAAIRACGTVDAYAKLSKRYHRIKNPETRYFEAPYPSVFDDPRVLRSFLGAALKAHVPDDFLTEIAPMVRKEFARRAPVELWDNFKWK